MKAAKQKVVKPVDWSRCAKCDKKMSQKRLTEQIRAGKDPCYCSETCRKSVTWPTEVKWDKKPPKLKSRKEILRQLGIKKETASATTAADGAWKPNRGKKKPIANWNDAYAIAADHLNPPFDLTISMSEDWASKFRGKKLSVTMDGNSLTIFAKNR